METTPFVISLLLSLPAVIVAIVTAFTAKKSNAQWRARRAAKLAASDVVPEVAAH